MRRCLLTPNLAYYILLLKEPGDFLRGDPGPGDIQANSIGHTFAVQPDAWSGGGGTCDGFLIRRLRLAAKIIGEAGMRESAGAKTEVWRCSTCGPGMPTESCLKT